MKNQKAKVFALGLSILLVSLACGQLSIGVEDNTTTEQIENTPEGNSASVEAATPEPETGSEQYWVEVQDPQLGFRYAVPCFWYVEFPTNEAALSGGYSYQIYNYPPDYPLSFPRSQIPAENGAIKVSFEIIDLAANGLPVEISLAEYIAEENNNGSSEVLAVDEVTLNQTPAVSATIHYLESDYTGRYYLLRINAEKLLRILVYPSSKIFDSADLQGILSSITLDSQAEVPLPTHTPFAPPIGLAAPCIPEYAVAVEPVVVLPEGNTPCGLSSFESLDFLTEKVIEYLQMRNTGGLRWEYLFTDPFIYRNWGEEAQSVGADQFATMLANQLYDASGATVMTFTSDREQFPPLGGNPPESLLGPGVTFVEVIYSEGWGLDGLGAALLYFAQDECGGYYWYGIVFDNGHFDG